MTSRHETEINPDNELKRHPERPMPESSDAAYERLTGYGFVRRFTRGKTVANICWEEIGYGSHLLSENAKSVVGLVNSAEAVDLASAIYSAPNTSYQRAGLPELPYSEDYFDVVVAFRVLEHLEHPEGLVRESKRVLKQGGTLVISVPDKQTNASSHRGVAARRGMYVPEFRELLERSFGHVRIYRQGAVAGGFVFPDSGEIGSSTSVESARFSLSSPDLGVEPPTIRSVMAVCSDIDALGRQEERPYLLLDRDRWVFDECEKHAEDVELLRDEIQRMQETEVQAFLTTLRSYESRAAKAGRGLVHVRNLIYGAKRRLFGSRRQKS